MPSEANLSPDDQSRGGTIRARIDRAAIFQQAPLIGQLARLDQPAVLPDGPDGAAGRGIAFEEGHRVALLVQAEGGGQAGDAGADNGDALGGHVRISSG